MAETDAETKTLALADGRTLAYAIYGTTTTTTTATVFYFHGFPGSHHEAALFSEAARRHGLRVVAPSRPGMGGSTLQPKRALLSYPDDVLALADYLCVSRFALLGVSGGGPYVLACWKCIPRTRLVGGAIVSGLYPTSLGGLGGMMLGARMLLAVAPWVTGLVAYGLDSQLGAAARDDEHPERFEGLLAEAYKGRPAVERAAWEADVGGMRGVLVKSTREAVRAGGQGPAWEARLFGSAWGFGLDELEVNKDEEGRSVMVMWHGTEDTNVPLAMAQKAAALMPGAELRVEQGEGHGSLVVKKTDEVMAMLKKMFEA